MGASFVFLTAYGIILITSRPPTNMEREKLDLNDLYREQDRLTLRPIARFHPFIRTANTSTITYWTSNVPSAGADQVFLLYAQGPVCVAAARSLNEIPHTSTQTWNYRTVQLRNTISSRL
jgi:hypothetical protein